VITQQLDGDYQPGQWDNSADRRHSAPSTYRDRRPEGQRVLRARALADKTGLTGGLSKALASRRLLVHGRGRVLADLACAIADGAEVISDFRV
jgi:hypothetical protein